MTSSKHYFIGVDVQSSRHCPYVVLNETLRMVESGWIPNDSSKGDIITNICSKYPKAYVGLDSPREPLPKPRDWYWQRGKWNRRTTEAGLGRHCEVVIKAHNLANPQWTPVAGHAPLWMQIGFALFREFQSQCKVFEVFPSASYRMFKNTSGISATLSFENFQPGPKDMLDAAVAAITVAEFIKGYGCEVGGGDGLGTIILPRPVTDPISAVLSWPEFGNEVST